MLTRSRLCFSGSCYARYVRQEQNCPSSECPTSLIRQIPSKALIFYVLGNIAVSHIMNDDVDTAEKLLGDGASPFHKVPHTCMLRLGLREFPSG